MTKQMQRYFDNGGTVSDLPFDSEYFTETDMIELQEEEKKRKEGMVKFIRAFDELIASIRV